MYTGTNYTLCTLQRRRKKTARDLRSPVIIQVIPWNQRETEIKNKSRKKKTEQFFFLSMPWVLLACHPKNEWRTNIDYPKSIDTYFFHNSPHSARSSQLVFNSFHIIGKKTKARSVAERRCTEGNAANGMTHRPNHLSYATHEQLAPNYLAQCWDKWSQKINASIWIVFLVLWQR